MKTSKFTGRQIASKIKNWWFACQLLVVAVSLPAMSVYQISHTANREEIKKEKIISKTDSGKKGEIKLPS